MRRNFSDSALLTSHTTKAASAEPVLLPAVAEESAAGGTRASSSSSSSSAAAPAKDKAKADGRHAAGVEVAHFSAVRGPSALLGVWDGAATPESAEVAHFSGDAAAAREEARASEDILKHACFAYYAPHDVGRSTQRQRLFMPPLNFSMVIPGIYRSGLPKRSNFGFLRKLGLRSMVSLMHREYDSENTRFAEQNGIQLFHRAIDSNKEPFMAPNLHDVVQLLHILLNPDHHPILVHCTKGQHRTGCLIGCLRKLQNWSLSSIFQEYTHFTTPRYSRMLDHQFIELFPHEPELVAKMAQLGHI